MRARSISIVAVLLALGECSAWPSRRPDDLAAFMRSQDSQLAPNHPTNSQNTGDCQMTAARALQVSCTETSLDGVSEALRQDVAISLTLCSMHSAIQKPPDECAPWLSRTSDSRERDDQNRARCLSALHRSPQDWSTYNIYLSDATQLCYAINGRYQAREYSSPPSSELKREDLVHQTYRNITDEKQALLRSMQAAAARRDEEALVLNQVWLERMTGLEETLKALDRLQQSADNHVASSHATNAQLQKSVRDFDSGRDGFWRGMELSGKEALVQMLRAGQAELRSVMQSQVEKLASSLDKTRQSHADQLRNAANDISSQLAKSMGGISTVMAATEVSLKDRDLQQGVVFRELVAEMGAVSSLVSKTSGNVIELRHGLYSSLAIAQGIQDAHVHISRSSEQVAASLHGFQTTSHVIADRLNQTMQLLDEMHARSWWQTSNLFGDAVSGLQALSSLAALLVVLQALQALGVFTTCLWLVRLGISLLRMIWKTLRTHQTPGSEKVKSSSDTQFAPGALSDNTIPLVKLSPPPKYGSLFTQAPVDRSSTPVASIDLSAIRAQMWDNKSRYQRSRRCVTAPP